MNETYYRISGMHCQSCADRITAMMQALPGVQSAQEDLAGGTLRLTGPQVDEARVRSSLEEEGYQCQALAAHS